MEDGRIRRLSMTRWIVSGRSGEGCRVRGRGRRWYGRCEGNRTGDPLGVGADERSGAGRLGPHRRLTWRGKVVLEELCIQGSGLLQVGHTT
jgi:hypothetical protein